MDTELDEDSCLPADTKLTMMLLLTPSRNIEEIVFYDFNQDHFPTMNYGETSESKLWSNVCNAWNPSIWDFHDELLSDKMDIELPVECFIGLDNHFPLAIVLYASNFSPPDCLSYYDVKFIGSCDPNQKQAIFDPLMDQSQFLAGNVEHSFLARTLLAFYLWFKENYKITHDDNSVPQHISLIGLFLTSVVNWFSKRFLGIIPLLPFDCEVPPLYVHVLSAILPCADMLGGEEFDYHDGIRSKPASSRSSVKCFDWEPVTRRNAEKKLEDKDDCMLLYGDIIDLSPTNNDGICPATTLQNFVTVTSDALPGALQFLHHQFIMWKTWKFRHKYSDDNAFGVTWLKDNDIPGIADFRFASFLAAILKLDLWATDTGNPSGIVVLIPKANYEMSSDKSFKGIVNVAVTDGEHLAFEINVAGHLKCMSNCGLQEKTWKFRRKIGVHVCPSLYPWLHHTIFGSIGFRLVSFLAALLKLDLWATDLGNPCKQS